MDDDNEGTTLGPAGSPADTKERDVKQQQGDKGGATLPEEPRK